MFINLEEDWEEENYEDMCMCRSVIAVLKPQDSCNLNTPPPVEGSGVSLTKEQLRVSQQGKAGNHCFVVFTAQVTLVNGLPWGCREVLWSVSRPLLLPVLFPFLLG